MRMNDHFYQTASSAPGSPDARFHIAGVAENSAPCGSAKTRLRGHTHLERTRETGRLLRQFQMPKRARFQLRKVPYLGNCDGTQVHGRIDCPYGTSLRTSAGDGPPGITIATAWSKPISEKR